GGAGNDTYYVHNAHDVVVEAAGQGVDTVNTTVSYTMPTNVEIMHLVGTGLTGTGRASGHNWITSMEGGNTLVGGAGGHDVFNIGASNEAIRVAAGTPDETVLTWATFSLPAN